MPPPCTWTRASCLLASTQARSGTHVGSAPCPRPVVPIRGSVGPVGVTDRDGADPTPEQSLGCWHLRTQCPVSFTVSGNAGQNRATTVIWARPRALLAAD